MEYDNRNSGVLFKNDRKQKDTDPAYTGSYTNSHRVEHSLSAWIHQDGNGNTNMKLKTSLKSDHQNQSSQSTPPQPEPSFAEDIPF